MAERRVIAVDLADVYKQETGTKTLLTTLAWGDEVRVEKITAKHVEIRLTDFEELPDGTLKPIDVAGFIRPGTGVKASQVTAKASELSVLKVDFVDVQQGDGTVIETPKGRTVLLDGGDNQLFARYLAGRYRGSSPNKLKEIDAIVVSHGDADHFAGLTEIFKSEQNKSRFKRLHIHPKHVYHNGLVKRPGKKNGKDRPDTEMLGKTATVGDRLVITGLETNLLQVDDNEMNEPFLEWKQALQAWRKRGAIKFSRLAKGDSALEFLSDEGIKVEILGPILTEKGATKGLAFLGNPKKGPRVGHESLSLDEDEFSGKSASHTINGHSIVLRLSFGQFNFLFAGDLNDESGRALTREHNKGDISLRAEVFKVPHHGSADFSGALLQAVSPVVSVVSSGDESARKEYIHPRATLMGALGRYSRIEEPLIFVTELVAFFNMEGWVTPEKHKVKDGEAVIKNGKAVADPKARDPFFAFSRTAFGIVKVRTDGKRLLVYTNSGQTKMKEAYAYTMDVSGRPNPDAVSRA